MMLLSAFFFLSAFAHLKSPDESLSIEVQIPKTEFESSVGLSKCKKLSKRKGMLFFESQEGYPLFTMEKTSIPLLFLFFDKNFELVEIQQGSPFQKELISPSSPCQYVIEAHPSLIEDYPKLLSSCTLQLENLQE